MTSPHPMPTKGIGSDEELFAFICDRASERPAASWEQIADDVGLTVADLLDWFLTYRVPKRERNEHSAARSPAMLPTNPAGGQWTLGANAQRYANWKRGHDAAAKARRE